jgi:hypothetical protein
MYYSIYTCVYPENVLNMHKNPSAKTTLEIAVVCSKGEGKTKEEEFREVFRILDKVFSIEKQS